MRRDLLTAFISVIVFTILLGFGYPMLVTGVSQVRLPGQGQRLADQARRRRRRLGADRPAVLRAGDRRQRQAEDRQGRRPDAARPALLPDAAVGELRTTPPARASRTSDPTTRRSTRSRATSQHPRSTSALEKPYDPSLTALRGSRSTPSTSSASSVDPDISVANADIQAHRIAAVRHLSLATVARADREVHQRHSLGFLGEPGVERARAQPRPRPPHREHTSRCRRRPRPPSVARSRCSAATSSPARCSTAC